jgi:hypothetical protein
VGKRFSAKDTDVLSLYIYGNRYNMPTGRLWIVMADEDGSMALAVTGTDSTAVNSHSLLTGLLWMLQGGREGREQQGTRVPAKMGAMC